MLKMRRYRRDLENFSPNAESKPDSKETKSGKNKTVVNGGGDNQDQLIRELKRLKDERKTFINKVEKLTSLNKKYQEQTFQAERSFREESLRKEKESKKLANLENAVNKVSHMIAKTREGLDATLEYNSRRIE